MVEDEARGRSLFEGSALKRVHRVENWVSNLFKYYFFSSRGLILMGELSGQPLERWVALSGFRLEWVGVGGRGASEGGREKKKWAGAGVD